MRGMIRDMLFYHASQFTVAAMKVRQARNLLDFLGKATSKDNTAYAHLLRGELESFRRSSDSYLYHEHLEEHNEPIYFYQFAERAAAAGLKYLGEADLRVMVPGNFPPEIENVLQMLAQDMIHLEQYMDFLRNRMFRQTLLVHKNATPNYQLKWEQLRAFHVGSPARMRSEGATGGARGDGEAAVAPPAPLDSDSPLLFETPEGITLQSREPIVKAAMVVLSEIWPGNMRFGDLVEAARKKLAATGAEPTDERKQAEGLGQAILQFHASAGSSLVELWFDPPTFEWTAGEKPQASALAREQAKTKSRVTNRRHESVNLGDFERQLLGKLDGTRDRATLVQELSKLADGQNSGPQEAPGSSWTMAEIVEKQLAMMGRSALLEAPAPIP